MQVKTYDRGIRGLLERDAELETLEVRRFTRNPPLGWAVVSREQAA